jgi:hypothetical protein
MADEEKRCSREKVTTEGHDKIMSDARGPETMRKFSESSRRNDTRREARHAAAAYDGTADLTRRRSEIHIRLIANRDASISFMSDIEESTAIVRISLRLAQVQKLTISHWRIARDGMKTLDLLPNSIDIDEAIGRSAFEISAGFAKHEPNGN